MPSTSPRQPASPSAPPVPPALAALLVADGRPAAEETVAVIFSGVRRG